MKVRNVALALLNEYETEGKYVNLSLQSHMIDSLSYEERAFLTALLYTTVERKITYDYYIAYLAGRGIDKIDTVTKNILRIGLCQILAMDSVPDYAAVNETVSLVTQKSSRSFVNGVLRRAVREKDRLPLPARERNASRYLSVAYSFPLYLVKKFVSLYGEEQAEQLLAAFNTSRATTLTVNTVKISVEDFIELLAKDGIRAERCKSSPISLSISAPVNPTRLPGFAQGYFFVQDEASAISAAALGAVAGERIVDVCACPGGKSFAAAILTGDRCDIRAFDISESKLPLIISGAERLGIHSVTAAVRDALAPDESLIGTCDRVICDVPCSGWGVISKKPDLRYKDASASEELPALQYEILKSSSSYLRQGGTLTYSTCTLNPAENSAVVEKFLEENPDFSCVDFEVGTLKSKGGMLTLLPHIHGTDGFFTAKIRKNK